MHKYIHIYICINIYICAYVHIYTQGTYYFAGGFYGGNVTHVVKMLRHLVDSTNRYICTYTYMYMYIYIYAYRHICEDVKSLGG